MYNKQAHAQFGIPLNSMDPTELNGNNPMFKVMSEPKYLAESRPK